MINRPCFGVATCTCHHVVFIGKADSDSLSSAATNSLRHRQGCLPTESPMGNLCSQVQTRDPEVYHQVYLLEHDSLPCNNMLLSDVHKRNDSQSGWEQPAGVVTLEPARSGFGDSSPTRRHSNVRPTSCSTWRLWPWQYNLTH